MVTAQWTSWGGHSSTCGWVLLLLTCFHMNMIILYCSSAVFWGQFREHYCRTAFGVVVVVVVMEATVIGDDGEDGGDCGGDGVCSG